MLTKDVEIMPVVGTKVVEAVNPMLVDRVAVYAVVHGRLLLSGCGLRVASSKCSNHVWV